MFPSMNSLVLVEENPNRKALELLRNTQMFIDSDIFYVNFGLRSGDLG